MSLVEYIMMFIVCLNFFAAGLFLRTDNWIGLLNLVVAVYLTVVLMYQINARLALEAITRTWYA